MTKQASKLMRIFNQGYNYFLHENDEHLINSQVHRKSFQIQVKW